MRDEATPDTVCVWQGWCCVLCVESPPPTNKKKMQQITQTGRSCVSHVDRSVLVLGYEKGYLKGGGEGTTAERGMQREAVYLSLHTVASVK